MMGTTAGPNMVASTCCQVGLGARGGFNPKNAFATGGGCMAG